MALALVRDLREHRAAASAEELADFETDVVAGFVLARASAGLADSTIGNDTGRLELIRVISTAQQVRDIRPKFLQDYRDPGPGGCR